MKILELESSKGWGGQEKRTARLVNNLPDEFQIFWGVAPDSQLYHRRKEIRGKFFPVEIRKSYDLKAIWKLANIIRREGIDIISTHSGKDGWVGAILGKLTGTKVVRTRHLLLPIRSPRSFNWSSRVVGVSQGVIETLKRGGVDPKKLHLIYTGIDTEKFRPNPSARVQFRREIGVKEGEVLIGIVAVLREAKRHQDLIKAVAPLQRVKLVIVGDGPQRHNLEKLITQMGLGEKVKLVGARDDVEKIYPALDIFALPSRHEALGTALLEAQSSGVPVVGSRVGGIPEAIAEGETGLLFTPLNLEELREKLKILIDNPHLRKKMGTAGRHRIISHFSITSMTTQTTHLYHQLKEEIAREF